MVEISEEHRQRFRHHAPGGASTRDGITADDTIAAHERVRKILEKTAEELLQILPHGAGRYAALTVTSLEETMHWANAGVAIHGGPDEEWVKQRHDWVG